jgi:hypothetical protein
LAARDVVIFHVFLSAFPGYPVDRAPWASQFIYGRFAVVMFIAVFGSVGLARPRTAFP